jgi:hypothetical protein
MLTVNILFNTFRLSLGPPNPKKIQFCQENRTECSQMFFCMFCKVEVQLIGEDGKKMIFILYLCLTIEYNSF